MASAGPALAHYHMLLPDKHSVERDAAATFTLSFGHPFEHQLFPAQRPKSVTVLAPDGQVHDLTSRLQPVQLPGADGKPVTAWRWSYTPARRGDHVVVARCEPVWMADERLFFDDTVKVILHVQTQNGWDAVAGGMELVPLTRPYGLTRGTVFQAQARGPAEEGKGKRPVIIVTPQGESPPMTGALVEVERYNPTPPKELPPDEFITRTVKTEPNGVATVTLPEPGWWAITAVRDGGLRERDGKSYPVKARCTLWVPVDDRVPLTPAK